MHVVYFMLGLARCKILKIEVDGLRALFVERRQHLSARCCFRPSKFVNERALILVEPPQSSFAEFSGAHNTLLAEPTQLLFRGLIQWNIEALSQDFTEWLTMDEAHPPATSKVGMLSSVECQEILQQNLSEHICTNLRLLVKTSSLLYNCGDLPHPHYSYEQITIMRQTVGANLLKSLEIALKNEALAQASRAQLLSLFIVLSGAIIAVRYTIPVSSEDVAGMLLRILAHYLVIIGERVGLLANELTKMSLTEGSNVLWNKTGNFEWNYKKVATGRDSETESPTLECLSPGFQTQRQYQIQDRHGDSITSELPERRSNGIPWNHHPVWHNNAMNDSDLTSQADLVSRKNQLPMLGLSNSTLPAATRYCFLCNKSLSIDGLCHTCLGSVLPDETAAFQSLESLRPSSAPVFAHPDMPNATPVNTEPPSIVQPINYRQTRDPECRISDTLGSDGEVLTVGRPVFQQEEAPKRKKSEPKTHFLRPKQLIQKEDTASEGYFSRSGQHTVNESLLMQGVEPTTSPTTTGRKRKRAPSPRKPYTKSKLPQRRQKSDKTRSLSMQAVETPTSTTATNSKQKLARSPTKPHRKAKLPHKVQIVDLNDSHSGSKSQRPSVIETIKKAIEVYCCSCGVRRLPDYPYSASFPRPIVESGGWICDGCPMSLHFGPKPPPGRFCYCYNARCRYCSTVWSGQAFSPRSLSAKIWTIQIFPGDL